MKTEKPVKDGKMTNEQLGGFHRRVDEIKRRVNEGTLRYDFVMSGLQMIIQNQIFSDFKIVPTPFDLSFVGEGWKIIFEEEDERSAEMTEVDFSKAKFVHCLEIEKSETLIKGEEKLLRLKQSKDIRLGASVFMALWQDYQAKKENSVLERLYQAGSIKSYLDFPGTILLAPGGSRRVLCLFRRDDGGWGWRVSWLRDGWDAGYLSVVSSQV